MPYELLDHTGDLAIRVHAATLEELFATAARAMFELIADAAEPREEVAIELDAGGADELLRRWLSELLYKFSADGRIFVDFAIDAIEGTRLRARARGERFDATRHSLRTELKAVTYHQLYVKPVPGGWEAQVIFDV